MRTSKHIRRAAVALALPLALASVGSVRAAEPTQAEADRIRAAVEEYIGTPAPGAPRIFDVRPKGEIGRAHV